MTMVMGRAGQSCAERAPVNANSAATAAIVILCIHFLPFCRNLARVTRRIKGEKAAGAGGRHQKKLAKSIDFDPSYNILGLHCSLRGVC
jgi:hypothetical protein